MNIEVGTASAADIPRLCRLLAQLFAQETEFEADEKRQARGLQLIIDGAGDIVVARKDDEIVGMVVLLYTVSTVLGSKVALLEDMVVDVEARGDGVGSKLIVRALEAARANGCRRITLLTDHDNDTAQRFYERHGFSRSMMVPYRLHL